jgi:prophage endopeptidase
MTVSWKLMTMFVMCGLMVGTAFYFHTQYLKVKERLDETIKQVDIRQATIHEMKLHQQDVATLDAKYTQELTDAQANIDKLQSDIANGARRLQFATTCPSVRSTTGPSGLDDAASARLTDAAQRHYITLRRRIETSNKQIAALQDYIRQQCLKVHTN